MVNDETRSGLGIIGSAAVLGGVHDLLFYALPLGLNVLLAVTLDCVALYLLVRRRGEPLPRISIWGAAAVLLFSFFIMLRDSRVLVAFDLLAILVAAGAVILAVNRMPLATAGLTDYARGLALTMQALLIGAVRDGGWKDLATGTSRNRLMRILRGFLLSVPLLLILGSLLGSADPVFGRLVTPAIDFGPLGSHLLVTGVFIWVLIGLFTTIMHRRRNDPRPEEWRPSLGATECTIVLAAVDLLFLTFVVVQVRYFFGGADLVATGTGLTYAEYARHGFFELVAVTAFELPLLLVIDWLARDRTRTAKILAALQVMLLFAIMASALRRMSLYRDGYGQTELRFYVTAFEWWMGFLFLWFAVTVLRDRRRYFAAGAALSACAVLLLLNILNPDAMIAEANCDRRDAGTLDAGYLTSLSADAVPVLLGSISRLSRRDQEVITSVLLMRWRSKEEDGLGFNIGRARARAAVDEQLRRPLNDASGSGPAVIDAPVAMPMQEPR